MSLWEEAVAFKDKNKLYFHPLHDPEKRISGIEKNHRKCLCRPARRCVCDQALEECRKDGSCACLLFVSREYLLKWCYIDEQGRWMSEKERKLLIKKREKEKADKEKL